MASLVVLEIRHARWGGERPRARSELAEEAIAAHQGCGSLRSRADSVSSSFLVQIFSSGKHRQGNRQTRFSGKLPRDYATPFQVGQLPQSPFALTFTVSPSLRFDLSLCPHLRISWSTVIAVHDK